MLARVASWFPFTAPILMPVRMTVVQVPWYEIAATLCGVAGGCAAAVWVAARIYRVGLLMHGKRPSIAGAGSPGDPELTRRVCYFLRARSAPSLASRVSGPLASLSI